LITSKSLFVASSWFLLYLLIKDVRSFEHEEWLMFLYNAVCALDWSADALQQ